MTSIRQSYILTLTLTLKIVYLDTIDILHLNYYVHHIGNKKYYIGLPRRPYKTYGCRYDMISL